MTHLLINQNVNLRREYLIGKINEYLGTSFEKFAQLHGNPDIHIIEFTEGESIKIEDVKQLQKELIFQPFKEKYQLGIICYAHNMTVEAQNAMLKALEEQGERTLYFLLVDSESGVLDTIVSRCVRHYVKSENFDVSLANNKQIADIDVRNASIASLFALISELSDEQPIPQNLIKQMTDKALAECLEEEDWEAKGKYTQLIVLLGESLKRLESNSSPRLLLENCVLKYKKSSP